MLDASNQRFVERVEQGAAVINQVDGVGGGVNILRDHVEESMSQSTGGARRTIGWTEWAGWSRCSEAMTWNRYHKAFKVLDGVMGACLTGGAHRALEHDRSALSRVSDSQMAKLRICTTTAQSFYSRRFLILVLSYNGIPIRDIISTYVRLSYLMRDVMLRSRILFKIY